ncbi:MAG TPA: hypothetical protein VN327_11385 [Pseudonocardiaceae bacterium]|nr:hypothetical protein [Pseudonocardiaceae bacterium]
MTVARPRWGARRVMALAAVGLPVLAGCSAAGSLPGPAASVVALRIDAPVHHLTWSDPARALFALTSDRRIAKIDPSGRSGALPTARTTLSAPFPDVGEDLVTRVTQGAVYLPQPELGRVAIISDTDLRQIATLPAGPAPSYLTLDSGSDDLLALSADHATVTPIDLHDDTILPATDVHAGPAAELDAGKRGRRIDYYLAGPGGITHYKGSPGSVQDEGEIGISAEKTASDLVKSSRLYVAEKGTDRLLAVDTKRTEDGLELVAQANLGEPVHYLGVDETRIYAATEHKLVVLKTNSFEGYHDQVFPIVTTIGFRSALHGEARNAPLSGLAVGPDRVYLTLEGQPYVLSIAKPSI